MSDAERCFIDTNIYFSEDLQHGLVVESCLRIVNPFAEEVATQ